MTDDHQAVGTTRHVRHLLPVLLVATVAYPVTLIHPVAAGVYAAAYLAVLALGARVAGVTKTRRRAAVALVATMVVLAVPRVLLGRPFVSLDVALWGLLAAFHVIVILAIFEYLLRQHEVDRDVLFAGTSLYVLVGDLFVPLAMVAHLVSERLGGSSAYSLTDPERWQDLVYYSFSTLTTVGYGDITPLNATAQALAVAEAVLGVLIVALIIGRLVGAAAGKPKRR